MNKNGDPTHVDTNGTKVVVLGGQLDTGVIANDLWVLDVPSMTWTQGPSASQARTGSACTLANDTLINWGGYSGLFPQPVDLFLYNLKTNKFVTEYKPTPPPKSSGGGTGHGNNSTSGSTSGGNGSHSMGAVIGGSVAGVVFVVAAAGIGFFFYRRRRSLQRRMVFQTTDRDGDDDQGIGNATLQGKDTQGAIKMSSPPRLETSLLGFIPSYRHGETGPEPAPMKEEFHEQERQWWRGTSQSRPYPMTTGDKDEWVQKENLRMAPGPVNAFKAGVSAATVANSLSPIQERQNFTPAAQQARSSVLNSPDSASSTTSSLVGTPSTLVNQLPYEQQQQHHQQLITPRFEQQQWPSSVSPVISHQQEEEGRQPWAQQQQQHQLKVQQNQQGPVSPPPLNYGTRPGGQKSQGM